MLNHRRSFLLFMPALAFIVVTILSGVILSSTTVSAEETVLNNVDISVPVSCNLNSSVDTAHTAIVNAGTSVSDIGTTNFTVFCNDASGFALYAIGYTNEDYGDNTLVGQSTNNIINTGTATSGNNSAWAMKMVKVTDGSYQPNNLTITNNFNNYKEVPDTYTKVAEYTTSTDATLGSKLQSTYRAFMSTFQDADTYNGKVKYTLVHPYDAAAPVAPLADEDCPANNVCYAPNAGDVVGTMNVTATTTTPRLLSITSNAQAGKQSQTRRSGSSTSVTNISTASTVELIAHNYSRSGYGFVGWSPDFEANENSTIYGPNETIDKPASIATQGLILYPVWVKSVGSLQDSTKVAELCGNGANSLTAAQWDSTNSKINATLSSVSALTDQRDGNTYAIAKLTDGNCWMIENLRLEAENSSNASLAQGFGTSTTYGNFTGLATSENANFDETNPPVANSLYSTDGNTTNTIQGGSSSYYYARMPRNNNNNSNRNLGASHNGTGNTTYYHWYAYGNYYTWAAAMANVKQYYDPTNKDDENKTSETANTSLCPSGWRLPYGRSEGNGATSKGFSHLDTTMGGSGAYASSSTTPTAEARSITWRSFPNNIVYAGYFGTDSAGSKGYVGRYWSSTTGGPHYSYYLYLDGASFNSGANTDRKYLGDSVRCVAGS